MPIIYVYNPDTNCIDTHDVGDIANLEAFERECNQAYESWSFDRNEMLKQVIDLDNFAPDDDMYECH